MEELWRIPFSGAEGAKGVFRSESLRQKDRAIYFYFKIYFSAFFKAAVSVAFIFLRRLVCKRLLIFFKLWLIR